MAQSKGKWIYAVADSGYQTGIKLGRASDTGRFLKEPSGYSPRPMRCVGAWFIDAEKWSTLASDDNISGLTSGGRDNAVEYWFRKHEGISPLRFEKNVNGITYRNGAEFLDVSTDYLLELLDRKITSYFGGPISIQCTQNITDTWDFMRSGNDKSPMYLGRQILWLWMEWQTCRIKIQRVSEWAGPRQHTWTYSRNGVHPISAFTYASPDYCDDEQDINVERCWQAVVSRFGDPDRPKILGWLSENITMNDLIEIINDHGLKRIDQFWNSSSRPTDVRKEYKGPKKRNLCLPKDLDEFLISSRSNPEGT